MSSYYHTDSGPYTAKIAQHWQLADKAPWMASGVWTWSRCVLPLRSGARGSADVGMKILDSAAVHVRDCARVDEGFQGSDCGSSFGDDYYLGRRGE